MRIKDNVGKLKEVMKHDVSFDIKDSAFKIISKRFKVSHSLHSYGKLKSNLRFGRRMHLLLSFLYYYANNYFSNKLYSGL